MSWNYPPTRCARCSSTARDRARAAFLRGASRDRRSRSSWIPSAKRRAPPGSRSTAATSCSSRAIRSRCPRTSAPGPRATGRNKGTPPAVLTSMRSVTLLLLAVPVAAHAEWNADLYGGVVYTPRSDITQSIGSPSGPADHTYHDVRWDNSAVLGARGGYWFPAAPWYGLGLDVFRYYADVPIQMVDLTISGATTPVQLQAIDFRVTTIALDVVRVRYQAGKLEPYASAGPALFKVKVTNRGNGELTT